MSSIHTPQRRALEALVKDKQSRRYKFGGNRRYFFEDFVSEERIEIFLWGISRGIGTCSDLPGVDIAVFGKERPTEKIPETTSCSFAALTRFPLPGECPEDGIARKVVELLEGYTSWGDAILFQPGRRKKIYVNTIC